MSTIGLGATLTVDDAGTGATSGAATAITAITDLDVPESVFGAAESKRLDIASKTLTKVPTIANPGSFTFTWEFSKAQMTRMDTLKGAVHSWVITLPEGSPSWTRTVPGFVSQNKPQPVNAEGIMHVVTTVEVTGVAS